MNSLPTIPPLPPDVPIDEHAHVIDHSCRGEERTEPILSASVPSYTLESILHSIEQGITRILLGAQRNRDFSSYTKTGKHTAILPELEEREYDELIVSMEKTRFRFDKELVPKQRIEQLIRFCAHFRIGEGYVVDEREHDDIIVQRMQAYQKEIARYQHLVPKVFFRRRLGSPTALSAKLMQEYRQEYLRQLSAANVRLMADEQEYLLYSIHKLTYTTQSGRKLSPNIREDEMVMALAYAVPARRVVTYTFDGDIKALFLFSRHLAPDKEVNVALLKP